MISIWRGIYLYATTFSMSLCFLILPSFSLTRYLCIDKNYTLSIFMLSGSIRFHSQIQFNIRHAFILNHTFYFIHDQCKTILMLIHFHMLFTLQIIDHIKICIFTYFHFTNHRSYQNVHFHMQTNLFNSNNEIQTYTPKDVFSLQITFTFIKVCYFTLSIQFTFMTDPIR